LQHFLIAAVDMRFYASGGVSDTGVYYLEQNGGERERGIILYTHIQVSVERVSCLWLALLPTIVTIAAEHTFEPNQCLCVAIFLRRLRFRLAAVKCVTRAVSLKGLPDACTVIDSVDKTKSHHTEWSIQSRIVFQRNQFPGNPKQFS